MRNGGTDKLSRSNAAWNRARQNPHAEMLASKFFDPVVGLDIHFELTPFGVPAPCNQEGGTSADGAAGVAAANAFAKGDSGVGDDGTGFWLPEGGAESEDAATKGEGAEPAGGQGAG